MESIVISTFPVLWFYSFLYYTDTGSTFFVLAGYYLERIGKYGPSAMVCERLPDREFLQHEQSGNVPNAKCNARIMLFFTTRATQNTTFSLRTKHTPPLSNIISFSSFCLQCLAISILFRQTNVIWACFVAGDIVSSILSPVILSSSPSERDSFVGETGRAIRKRSSEYGGVMQ